jgi:phosphoserine aminotransferase
LNFFKLSVNMTKRIFNFSAGPAVLPEEVLEQAQQDLMSLDGSGIGILEHSHRGKAFSKVHEQTEAIIREVGSIPDDYHIIFVPSGASFQFAMIPMNLLGEDQTADYITTGAWASKASKEAKRYGNVSISATSEDRNFCYIPQQFECTPDAAYLHYTSNNTIFGTQFSERPNVLDSVPLICDASSDIFSKPIDISKYAMVYASGQKNLGPAGVALVILRKDLLERVNQDLPTMLKYGTHVSNNSLYNTPPTFGIYLIGKVCQWIKTNGGLSGMQERNETKAAVLYDFIAQSDLFQTTADAGSRSLMNVTFVTGDSERDASFIEQATANGFDGLEGHRSVGGMRASIYNALPPAGVDALVQFMADFEAK